MEHENPFSALLKPPLILFKVFSFHMIAFNKTIISSFLRQLSFIRKWGIVCIALFSVSLISWGQVDGDYQTVSTGNWNVYTNWQVHSGGIWVNCASGDYPGATAGAKTVYITGGNLILITNNVLNSIESLDFVGENGSNQVMFWGSYSLTVTGAIRINPPTSNGNNNAIFVDKGTVTCTSLTSTDSGDAGRKCSVRLSVGGTLTVNGNIIMGITADRNDITFNGEGILNVTGDLTTGQLTCVDNCTINIGGSLTPTAFTVSTSTVNFNGAAQNIPLYTYYNLYTSGSGIKTLTDANFTVGGNLNISNSTLAFTSTQARTLSITGDLQGNGTIDMSSGNAAHTLNLGGALNSIGNLTTAPSFASLVNYNGSGNQTVFSSTNYRNLTVSNGGNKTLQGDITVGGILTLTNGKIVLGPNNLTLSDISAVGTPTATSYIVADGTGFLKKMFAAGATPAYLLPVGDAVNYSPVSLTFSDNSISRNIGVRVTDSQHPYDGTITDFISRYWSFTNDAAGTYTYNASFTFIPPDLTGAYANLKVNRWNGTSWTEYTNSGVSPEITVSGVTAITAPLNNSDFTGRLNPTTYTWNLLGSPGSWTTSSNWTPARITPASSDILIFDNNGTTTATNVPTQTIGKLLLLNSSDVSLQSAAAAQTLTISGGIGTDLDIPAGSTLRLSSSGSDQIGIAFNPATKDVLIAGSLIINSNDSFSNSYDASNSNTVVTGTVSNNGGIITSLAGNLNFNPGSFYIHGRDGGTVPAATWAATSTCTVGTGFSGTTPAGLTQSFGNFSMNVAQTLTLSANLTITNGLNLTSGFILLGNNDLIYSGTNANITGASSTSYVNASGTGGFIWDVTGTGNYLFPIGDATNYTPIDYNFLAGTFTSATLKAQVSASKHTNNTSTQDYLNRYWRMTPSGTFTAPSYTAVFTYVAGDVNGTEGNMVGGIWNGTIWNKGSAPVANTFSVASTEIGTPAVPIDFTGLDGTAPILSAVTMLSDNSNTAYAKTGNTVTLTITASENLSTLSGTIDGKATIPSGSGTSWTLTRLTDGTEAEGLLAFSISFSDMTGNPGVAVTDVTSGTKVTFDKTQPTVSTYNPLDDALNVGLNDNLVLTFIENVQQGTGGSITIYNSDNSPFEPIPYNDTRISFLSNTITINPTGTFTVNSGYYVQIDNNAISDIAGNNYAGIATSTTWNFTTSLPYFRSKAAGPADWNNIATWEESYDNLIWSDATVTPTDVNSNGILIQAAHTVLVNASVQADDLTVEGTLTVNSGQTLTIADGTAATDMIVSAVGPGIINNSGAITATGAIVFNGNATYNHLQNGGTVPAATWSSTSNVNITFSASATLNGLAQSFGNFRYTGGAFILTLGQSPIIKGNLTISAGTVADGGNIITVNGNVSNSGTHSGAGKIYLNGSILNPHAITSVAINTFGNLELDDIKGATFDGTGTTTINGNLTVTQGTLTLNSFTTALVVTGTTAIANGGTIIMANNTGTKTFADLIINNGGTYNSTVVQNVTITGNLQNDGTFTSNTGTYTFSGNTKEIKGANTITFSGAVTVSGAITIFNTNTNINGVTITGALNGSVAGSTFNNKGVLHYNNAAAPMATGILDAGYITNTVSYDRAGAQAIKAPATSYYNLTLSTSGVKTLSAATTVNGDITVSGTATLADGGFLITGTAGKTFTLGSGTAYTSTKTTDPCFPTNMTYALDNASTVNLNGTGTFTFTLFPTSFGNLLFGAGAASIKTLPATTPITINGNLTINANNTLADNGNSLTVKGTVINNGTHSGTGKISLNGIVAQSFTGTNGTYGNVELNNAAGATVGTSTLTIGGTFTNTAGQFSLNGQLLSIAGNITVDGGIFLVNPNAILSQGGNVNINAGGTFSVNGNYATLKMANGTTITNAGGTFRATGGSATQIATLTNNGAGTFNIVQTSGTFHARYYLFEYCNIKLSGGSIDGTNNFNNGAFSNGSGSQYLDLTGMALGTVNTSLITFNNGPDNNIKMISGSGTFNITGYNGALSGVAFENDGAAYINWVAGTTFYSQNVNSLFSNLAHWNTSPSGGGSSPSAGPPDDRTSGLCTFIVQDGHAASVDFAGLNVYDLIAGQGGAGATLTIDGTGAARTITVRNDLTVFANSTMNINAVARNHILNLYGNLVVNGNFDMTAKWSSIYAELQGVFLWRQQ